MTTVMTTQKVRGFCVKNRRFKSSYHPCEEPFPLPAVLNSTEAPIQGEAATPGEATGSRHWLKENPSPPNANQIGG